MAGATSVPPLQFTQAGLVLPDETAVKAGVFSDMNAAFGGNLNPGDATPQGQLVASQSAIIGAKNDAFAYFVNQIDPATADGFMQDAIGRLYFLDRLPSRATTVDVICSGLTGVTIPAGSLVQDSSGNVYASNEAGTIPSTGSVTIPFSANVPGPIACPAGAITSIYKTVLGWDSAANTVDGITGADVESRTDFEYRRKLSVAANAVGSLQAIYASVVNVAGVTDAYCTENRTDAPMVKDGYTLLPHSLYAAAVGGTDQDVGEAIWRKVDVGCDFNGNTTVTVTDTSGYNLPAPTYPVTFMRPADLSVYFAVTVQNLSALPNSTVAANIRQAIVAAFSGSDGGQRARIASTIFATRFILPVSLVGNIAILSIFVGATASPVGASLYIPMVNSPTIDPNNIAVTFI